MKVRRREELGLPPLPEDSIQVMRSMRAASPPTCSIELAEQQQKRGHRSRRVRGSSLGMANPSPTRSIIHLSFHFPSPFLRIFQLTKAL